MTTESRAEFARRMGWHRSSVGRAVKDGRVVLVDGKVDVEASLAKIDALANPAPHHRAHAQQLEEGRAAKSNAAPPVDPAQKENIEALNLRLKKAEADKREHEADIARMERERIAGNLLPLDDVNFSLDHYGATLRSLMENFADRMTPVVFPLQTQEETHAMLDDAAMEVLRSMHDAMQKKTRDAV